jgi:L-malate glycosyltransferase
MPQPSPRILMVSIYTPPYFFAGAGNQAVVLSRALIEQGCAVSLITSHGEAGWVSQDPLEGLPVFRLRGSRQKHVNVLLFNFLSVLWWLFNARNYDVVHIHGATNMATLVWIPLAKWWGKKSLLKITCSGVDDLPSLKKFRWVGPFAHYLAKQADGFIALTPEIVSQLKQDAGGDKIFQIPNGLDPTLFHSADSARKAELRATLNLPTTQTLLVYTGGINPRKNVLFLVESVALLKDRYPDVQLYIVGPCKIKFLPYQTEIQSRIRQLGLEATIHLTGEVPYKDVALYLQASDIFVFASTQEGLPSSPIEAMACGLPTVIVELPGVTDWLYENNHALALITEPNPEDFADSIAQLLNSEEKRQTMSKLAVAYAQKRFKVSVIAQQYRKKIYPKLLRQK